MKYLRLLLFCLSLAVVSGELYAGDSTDVYRVVKSSTGQTYLLAKANTGDRLHVDVYFRIGPIYEQDSMSGISLMITKIIDKKINEAISGRQINYYSTTEPEQLGFHFECTAGDLDYSLSVINDKVVNARFDSADVKWAKTAMRSDIDRTCKIESIETRMKTMNCLWGKDFKKLNIYGDRTRYTEMSRAQFDMFHNKYFLPLNNSILITGTFAEKEMVAILESSFKGFRTKEFNPELINRVIEFKPFIYSVQLTSGGSDTAVATVSYQGPGARQDRAATYAAFMLSALINDQKGTLARSVIDSNIIDVKASFDCNNFYGIFSISAKVLGHNYNYAFSRLDSLIGNFSRKGYFKNDELASSQMSVMSEFNGLRAHTYLYMTQVAKYRFSNDENYFQTLADSIGSVSVEDMHRYVEAYFVGHAGVKCLYARADTTVPDSLKYYALDESIKDLTFRYELNISDIDTVVGKQDLHRLIQWLTINPDVHVQINGFADKGEFSKSYDSTVIRFINSTPSFRKAMPDAVRISSLRIEMMRAMKIAKALYEAGIGEDRISGTSMTFSSDTREAAAANRKCTVTLEKILPRPSLYEYHFGKKKEESEPVQNQ